MSLPVNAQSSEMGRILQGIDTTHFSHALSKVSPQKVADMFELAMEDFTLYLERVKELMSISILELDEQISKNAHKAAIKTAKLSKNSPNPFQPSPRMLIDIAEQKNGLIENQRKAGDSVGKLIIEMMKAQVTLEKIRTENSKPNQVNNVIFQKVEQYVAQLDRECPPELQEYLIAAAAEDVHVLPAADGVPVLGVPLGPHALLVHQHADRHGRAVSTGAPSTRSTSAGSATRPRAMSCRYMHLATRASSWMRAPESCGRGTRRRSD